MKYARSENNNPFYLLWLGFRSTIFWIGFAGSTILIGVLTPLLYVVPAHLQYKILLLWPHFNVWLLKIVCGVQYQVKGLAQVNMAHNAILLPNHQSTWETLLIPTLFPSMSWVIKRELYKIPFYGWALPLLKPIGIDRSAGSSAVKQVKTIGKQRLDEGNWVCIFPEGTRVAPGVKVRYKMGGALLAHYSQYPVYPIAHNAGECWARNAFIKRPGIITVSIGAKINSTDSSPSEINEAVRSWIEAELTKLPPVR
ncbi:MAG: 1-acyl-sn-glycerol-3-phosphate acyltransferase [Cocleimonas sp.]|nr:1-acyl-sn-glycerol-3-phosphate acyltransferase [Cocleimonas sp.]